MRVLFNKKFLLHNVDSEFEGAYRLIDFPTHFEDEEFDGEPYFELVHSKSYIKKFKQACEQRQLMAEVELSPDSYNAARTAVGLSILASMQGDFAVVRPPGHHASREKASGFCFFNNMAIAAQHLVNDGKKVLIIDIDGHHGDGTQKIFYDNDRVFYASLHQSFTFPHTGSSAETGEGKGLGFTLNIPMMPGSGDKEFLNAIHQIIIAGHQFKPDVVGISAGFDGYEHDHLLSLKFTTKAYYECGFRLRRAFKNIFAILEGGYHADIHACVSAFIIGINVGSLPIRSSFDHEMSIG